jgi:Outer membrane protein beta-barrel domain
MKKIVIVLLFVFINSNAQENVRFGLKAGLNISKLTISGINVAPEVNSKLGFHAGAFLAFKISEKFGLQPEALYSNQGYKTSFKDGFNQYKVEANINYIAIPIMIKFYPVKKFNIEVGPQISFLLNHKGLVNKQSLIAYNDPAFGNSTVELDFEDKTQSIEFGLNAGVSYQINNNIIGSARYNFGISNVNKELISPSGEDQENDRNSVFQFSLNYLFD